MLTGYIFILIEERIKDQRIKGCDIPCPRVRPHSSSELGSIFRHFANIKFSVNLNLEPDRGESEVEEGEREPAEEENGDHGDQKFARSKIVVAIYIVIGIIIFREERGRKTEIWWPSRQNTSTFCIF